MRTFGLAVLAVSAIVSGLSAQGHSHGRRASAELAPGQEVPIVVSPAASGLLSAVIDDDARTIEYRLTFSGLQALVTQSHIHIAQPSVNGGIVVWLCQTPSATDPVNPNTQQCPVNGGTITGTIVPSDVRAVAAQGIAAALSANEKFDRVVAAIRSGYAYANVHTVQSPGGEIRGQIEITGRQDREHKHD